MNCNEISRFPARPIWRENIARLDDPSNIEIEFPFEARVSSFRILNVLSRTGAQVQPWYYSTPPTSSSLRPANPSKLLSISLLDWIATLILKLSQVCGRQTAQAKKVAMTDHHSHGRSALRCVKISNFMQVERPIWKIYLNSHPSHPAIYQL